MVIEGRQSASLRHTMYMKATVSITSLFTEGRKQHWLGPAKTYILRGTPRTCAIKTRAATDN